MSVEYRTFTGNIVQVYEKRTVGKDNRSVINFNVAVTGRQKNRETGQWEDAPTRFHRCVAWNRLADNVEKSFNPGDRVIVHGRVEMNEYEDKDGEKRESEQIVAEFTGHSLEFWPAHSERDPSRKKGSNSSQSNTSGGSRKAASKPAAQEDILNEAEEDDLLSF